MTLRSSRDATRPRTVSCRPGSMPAMCRRPEPDQRHHVAAVVELGLERRQVGPRRVDHRTQAATDRRPDRPARPRRPDSSRTRRPHAAVPRRRVRPQRRPTGASSVGSMTRDQPTPWCGGHSPQPLARTAGSVRQAYDAAARRGRVRLADAASGTSSGPVASGEQPARSRARNRAADRPTRRRHRPGRARCCRRAADGVDSADIPGPRRPRVRFTAPASSRHDTVRGWPGSPPRPRPVPSPVRRSHAAGAAAAPPAPASRRDHDRRPVRGSCRMSKGDAWRVDRDRTLEDRPEQPARAVDADEAQVDRALWRRDPGAQRGSVLAVATSSTAAPPALSSLRMSARTSSQTLSLRGAANTRQHQRIVGVHERDLLNDAFLVGLHADRDPVDDRNVQAAEARGARLRRAPRKCRTARSPRRIPRRRSSSTSDTGSAGVPAWSRDRRADPLRPRSGAAASYAVHSRDLARRSPLCLASLVPGALPRPFARRATAGPEHRRPPTHRSSAHRRASL